MLRYESEGCLEVADEEIVELYRSTRTVVLPASGNCAFRLQAVLCLRDIDPLRRAQVSFYCRDLKRALQFKITATSNKELVQQGLKDLNAFGLQMEAVNLKLSSALRQVVLQDIPGLLSPEQAERQRSQKKARLAEIEAILQQNPRGDAGIKTLRKLDAERREEEQLTSLIAALVGKFVPKDMAGADEQSLNHQDTELAERLAETEAMLGEERTRLERTERILAAAETRIQELEEKLVEVETRAAKVLNNKQDIVKLEGRIKALTTELGSARELISAEQEKPQRLTGDLKAASERADAAEKRKTELEIELEQALAELANEKSAQNEHGAETAAIEQELTAAREHAALLEKELKKAEKKAKHNARDEQRIADFRKRLEAYEKEQQASKLDIEQERDLRKHLEQQVSDYERRVTELEKKLADAEQPLSKPVEAEAPALENKEISRLKTDLQEAIERAEAEKQDRVALNDQLKEAHRNIEVLEKTLRESRQNGEDRETARQAAAETLQFSELAEKLKLAESRLEQELVEQKKSVSAVAEAQERIVELEKELLEAREACKGLENSASLRGKEQEPVPSSKKLPHELKPAPQKGALFHPDWKLAGLPCKSADQVIDAWESTFNVQLSLEGYPSQYCTAFLVMIEATETKQLFMLFRLKKNNHTLVMVPAEPPADDAAMGNMLREGKRFLQLSGFVLEPLAPENVPGMLGSYFLEN